MTATATAVGGRVAAPASTEDRLAAQARLRALRALGGGVLTFVLSLVAVLALWVLLLLVLQVSPLIAKGPIDVWNYFFTVPAAATNRAFVAGNLAVTLGHASIGFIAGLVVATAGAALFQLSRGAEHALMPIAMLLRSVPLVAMAPVIILIFGRDVLTVAVIGGIVVLFPALVNITFGLKSASVQMNDLVTVYGAGAWTRLRVVAMPSSLPAFFAAVRISVPGAITGALLAEWLATGGGIGGNLAGLVPRAQFTALWASVVVITVVSLVLYNVIQIVEDVVLARMGMRPQRGV